MWQEAAFFRAVAHYDTFGLHAWFSKSLENLQKNNDTPKLAFKYRLRASVDISPTTHLLAQALWHRRAKTFRSCLVD